MMFLKVAPGKIHADCSTGLVIDRPWLSGLALETPERLRLSQRAAMPAEVVSAGQLVAPRRDTASLGAA